MSSPESNPESPRPKIKFTGIWIPAEVWVLPTLSITEKALYGCIHSLGGFSTEGCYASNAFLAERFAVAEGSINNMLNSLKRDGLVRQTIRSGVAGKFRQLWLAHPHLPRPQKVDENTLKDVFSSGENTLKDVDSLHPNMQTAPRPIKRRDKRKREEGNARLNAASVGHPVILAWNAQEALPKVLTTSGRAAKLAARMKEPFFVENYAAAILKVVASKFCLGESESKWKATFDFFIRPATVPKIMEGIYDDKKPATPPVEKVFDKQCGDLKFSTKW